MSAWKRTLLSITALLVCSKAFAGVYYMSTAGNDANAGSQSQPWRSITKANAMVVAGDYVYIMAGTYADPIAPARSGVPGNPIVYKNYQADVCSLYVMGTCVDLTGLSYVVVDGIHMRMASSANNSPVRITGGDHNALLHCRVYGGTTGNTTTQGDWCVLKLEDVRYTRIIGNYIDRLDFAITQDAYRGDGINLNGDNSNYNIIEGNEVCNVSHFAIDVPTYTPRATMNIIRNNRVHTAHGLIGNGNGALRNLYEANTCWSPDQVDTYRSGTMGEWSGRWNILRYNKMAHDDQVIPLTGRTEAAGEWIAQMDYAGNGYGGEHGLALNTDTDNRIYHNSFIANARTDPATAYHWKFVAMVTDGGLNNDLSRRVWAGNIFAFPTDTTVFYFQNVNTNESDPTDTMRANIFWRGRPAMNIFTVDSKNHKGTYTMDAAKKAFPLWIDPSNKEASPLWVDSLSEKGDRNYTLTSRSPCIDAGPVLARVMATSNGTTLRVSDASYFHYAWGASPYDRGDSLLIGGRRVEVLNVDYTTNDVTVRQSVAVNAGDPVYVLATWFTEGGYQPRLYGSAPDIGPVEYNSGPAAGPGTAPSTVALSTPPEGSIFLQPSVTLSWLKVQDAATYGVQVASSSLFAAPLVNRAGINDSSLLFNTPDSNTTYFWRVRGENGAGAGSWSPSRSFTMASGTVLPKVAALAAPVNDSTGLTTNPVLSWKLNADASSYRIQLARSSDFATRTLDSSGMHATTCSLDGLLNGAEYFWRIQAVNAAGSSPWSPTSRFQTFALPIASSVNAVSNPDFAKGTAAWQLSTDGKDDFSVSSPGHKDSYYAKIHVVPLSSNVELSERGLMIQPDTVYRLSFSAYSTMGNSLDVSLVRDEAPFTSYGLSSRHVQLTTAWKEYSIDFTSKNFSSCVNNGRLAFRFDKNVSPTDVFGIDGVQLAKSNGEPSAAGSVPADYELAQNYPNPFNPTTSIRYRLPGPASVTLTVFNALGQQVAVLDDGMMDAGDHEAKFDATGLASGFYLYRLVANDYVQTRKMLLVH